MARWGHLDGVGWSSCNQGSLGSSGKEGIDIEVICDIETDGLNPKNIWVIGVKEIESGKVHVFPRPDLPGANREAFLAFSKGVTKWIGHYFIQYDYLTVLRPFGLAGHIAPLSILDTLVCSRVFNFGVDGGHSLDAWAVRLKLKTQKHVITDWSQGWTEDMRKRVEDDLEINYQLYRFLEKHIKHEAYQKALALEHKMEFICVDMHRNGFGFNKDKAVKIQQEIDADLAKLDEDILRCFPPRYVPIREVTPKLTAKGTLSLVDFRWAEDGHDFTQYTDGASFTRIRPEPFNPASPSQVVERLNEAGWRPYEKTKGHIKAEQSLRRARAPDERALLTDRLKEYKIYGWSISEDNLDTLPETAPEGARKLAQRLVLASRRSVIQEWLNAYNEDTGSIHGTFMSIGAWTQRMSHLKPNQGNIPTTPDVRDKDNPTPVEQWKLKYSAILRECFVARKGRRLVGVDADAIQLRILAHYMNDEDFIKALVSGDKLKKTDVHTLNAIKLGLSDSEIERARAKTFIYAWLLGAGIDKVAHILHNSTKDARTAVNSFIEGYPGLKLLKSKQIPEDAKKGYFIGLDGRLVPVPSEHHMLAGYLQNGEQLIMKTAAVEWRTKLKEEKFPFWMVDFVHDEWQVEVNDDDAEAQYAIDTMSQAIVNAGVLLKMNCPLAGQGKQGYNWGATH